MNSMQDSDPKKYITNLKKSYKTLDFIIIS